MAFGGGHLGERFRSTRFSSSWVAERGVFVSPSRYASANDRPVSDQRHDAATVFQNVHEKRKTFALVDFQNVTRHTVVLATEHSRYASFARANMTQKRMRGAFGKLLNRADTITVLWCF